LVNGGLTVYTAGFSPVRASVSHTSSGGYAISYSVHGGGSDASFTGQLNSEDIQVHYAQDGHGGAVVNHIAHYGGTHIEADFTTTLTALSPDEIPGNPGPGRYRIDADYDSVLLSWGAATGNVSGYEIYRQVVGVDGDQKLLARTTGTSYTDRAHPVSLANSGAHDLLYWVYAIGPTGLDSAQDILISILLF
jgi:hypothetical protein